MSSSEAQIWDLAIWSQTINPEHFQFQSSPEPEIDLHGAPVLGNWGNVPPTVHSPSRQSCKLATRYQPQLGQRSDRWRFC